MRYLFVFSLLPLLTACPEDDILGRGDGGPPRVIDAGPAPHELPIYPGDQFRYQGLIAVTQGCAEGHVNDACERQGTWYQDILVTEKIPDKQDGDCPMGTSARELNVREELGGGSVTYCIPENWDNIFQLVAENTWDLFREHPDMNLVANSWLVNLAPWTESRKAPHDGEQRYRTNLAMLPERNPTPYPWALDLSKWEVVSGQFESFILEQDPNADINKAEGGAYMKAIMNYDRGAPVRHKIEILYHDKGYLCKFDEEIGPPGARPDDIQKSEDGSIRAFVHLKADAETNPDCESGVCVNGRMDGQACSQKEDCGWVRRRPKCCSPLVPNCR